MVDYLDELTGMAREYLPPGEETVAAVAVTYAGKVNLLAPPTGLAALSLNDRVAAGEELVSRRSEPEVTFPTARQMALVLSAGRILIWSRGGLKGRPKAFLGEVPLDGIDKVRHEPGQTGTHLFIGLGSGWEYDLECGRGAEGDTFARALEGLMAASAGDPGPGTVTPLRPDPSADLGMPQGVEGMGEI